MKPLHTATLAPTATLVACGSPTRLHPNGLHRFPNQEPTHSIFGRCRIHLLTLEHDGTTEQCTFALPFDAASAVCTQGSELELNGNIIRLNHPLEMGMQFDTVFVELGTRFHACLRDVGHRMGRAILSERESL